MYDELVATLRRQCVEMGCGNCNTCVNRQAAEAIEKLSKLRWIPVSERLPEIGEIVLAYVDELRLIIRARIVDAKDYRGERRIDWARVDPDPFFLSCYKITHWMPLPEPPKEE